MSLEFASVAVVIPCYKAHSFLERAVDSVLHQTVKPRELIFVDDASPDDGKTKRLIERLQLKIASKNLEISVIAIYLDQNIGPGGARNVGWDSANQPWIAFLDADDAWHPGKLEIQYRYMLSNKNIELSAHKSALFKCCSFDEDSCDSSQLWESIKLIPLLFKNKISTRSVMLKRDCRFRFNPVMRYSEDYDLWLRIISSGGQASYLNKKLAYIYRPEWSVGGLSADLWAMQKGECKALLGIFRQKKILVLILLLAVIYSWIKFIRRLLTGKVNSYK